MVLLYIFLINFVADTSAKELAGVSLHINKRCY